MAHNPRQSFPATFSIGSMSLGGNSSNIAFHEHPMSKKILADIEFLSTKVDALEAEVKLLKKSSDSQGSSSDFATETVQDVQRKLDSSLSSSNFLEFVTKNSEDTNILQDLVQQLKNIENLNAEEPSIIVSDEVFLLVKEVVNGILLQDTTSLTGRESRRRFLKLADYFSKTSKLFDAKLPYTNSGPLYLEKLRRFCAKLHLLLFRGISMFKLSNGTTVTVTVDGIVLSERAFECAYIMFFYTHHIVFIFLFFRLIPTDQAKSQRARTVVQVFPLEKGKRANLDEAQAIWNLRIRCKYWEISRQEYSVCSSKYPYAFRWNW